MIGGLNLGVALAAGRVSTSRVVRCGGDGRRSVQEVEERVEWVHEAQAAGRPKG